MFLFHATYQCYLNDILREGLLTCPSHHNWSWGDEYSQDDRGLGPVIFLANDYEVAESFAESADYVENDVYDSGIVILAIDTKDLDLDYLSYDPFYHNDIEDEFEDPFFEYLSVLDQATCFAYGIDIPANVINVCD